MLVWELIAQEFFCKDYKCLPIVVENMFFKRASILSTEEELELTVNVLKNSGSFEIYGSGSLVASGYIKGFEKLPFAMRKPVFDGRNLTLKKKDFYKEFGMRKQQLSDIFRGVLECDFTGTNARLEWKGKVESFVENMSQIGILKNPNCRSLVLQTYLEKITIDPVVFFANTEKNPGKLKMKIEIKIICETLSNKKKINHVTSLSSAPGSPLLEGVFQIGQGLMTSRADGWYVSQNAKVS